MLRPAPLASIPPGPRATMGGISNHDALRIATAMGEKAGPFPRVEDEPDGGAGSR